MTRSQGVQGPRIKRLDEAVVNKIAAGEVVQRPASALKELLENSLDAGSTQVTVTVRDGGLSLLQIRDNGGGIHADDFPLLCRRHTTSKLAVYEDLIGIGTLGFRGEALCSISFVSRLSVITMQSGQEIGFRASFRDSEMVGLAPEPCAAVQGTCVTVEDLFYNVPNRRRALGSAAEELRRVVDVVAKYAVFKTGVSFTLKRHKQVKADILTLPHFTRTDAVRAAYGSAVASHLAPLQVAANWHGDHTGAPCVLPDDSPVFSVDGLLSTAAATVKRTTLVLFINGRPVECHAVKAALEGAYATLHAKAAAGFWAFLDVRLPAAHVDVNVHPTKAEVALLHQEELADAVRAAALRVLTAGNDSRPYPRARTPIFHACADPEAEAPASGSADAATQRARAGGDHKLVRSDHRSQTLAQVFGGPLLKAADTKALLAGSVRRRGGLKRTAIAALDGAEEPLGPTIPSLLSSQEEVQGALKQVEANAHTVLTRIVREYVFVGHLDQGRVLLQHGTKLYVVDVASLSRDLFYQLALRGFKRLRGVRIRDAPELRQLVEVGLEAQAAGGRLSEADGAPGELCDMISELLTKKADILGSFRISITPDSQLVELPELLPGYSPDTDRLPELLISLAGDVDWTDEPTLCTSIAEILADMYAECNSRGGVGELGPQDHSVEAFATPSMVGDLAGDQKVGRGPYLVEGNESQCQIIEHVLLPAFRRMLLVPHKRAADGTVVQIAALEQLYKVFERC